MAEIDFAMLTTRTDGGQFATPPMSNTGEVEYDGDSFYFSWDSARIVSDIGRDPHVALSFQGSAGLLGKPPPLVSQGIDTEGMVMIHVHADRIHYWDSNDEAKISI